MCLEPNHDTKLNIGLSKQQADTAFTLIEVLVVVAIVVVLASLIGMLSSRLVTASQQTQNINNLRQIGLATLTFAADHGGKIPENLDPKGKNKNTRSLGRALGTGSPPRKLVSSEGSSFGTGDADYIESIDVFYSPFVTEQRSRSKGDVYISSSGALHIGYMWYFLPRNDEQGQNPVHPEIFNDRLTENARSPIYSDVFEALEEVSERFTSNTMNVLYLDGSVQSFEYSKVAGLPGWQPRLEYMTRGSVD